MRLSLALEDLRDAEALAADADAGRDSDSEEDAESDTSDPEVMAQAAERNAVDALRKLLEENAGRELSASEFWGLTGEPRTGRFAAAVDNNFDRIDQLFPFTSTAISPQDAVSLEEQGFFLNDEPAPSAPGELRATRLFHTYSKLSLPTDEHEGFLRAVLPDVLGYEPGQSSLKQAVLYAARYGMGDSDLRRAATGSPANLYDWAESTFDLGAERPHHTFYRDQVSGPWEMDAADSAFARLYLDSLDEPVHLVHALREIGNPVAMLDGEDRRGPADVASEVRRAVTTEALRLVDPFSEEVWLPIEASGFGAGQHVRFTGFPQAWSSREDALDALRRTGSQDEWFLARAPGLLARDLRPLDPRLGLRFGGDTDLRVTGVGPVVIDGSRVPVVTLTHAAPQLEESPGDWAQDRVRGWESYGTDGRRHGRFFSGDDDRAVREPNYRHLGRAPTS